MPITLVHLNDDVKERRLTVREGASLEIHAGSAPNGGLIVISAAQGIFLIENRSPVRCQINGIEIQRAAIHPGDRLEIGSEIYHIEAHSDNTFDGDMSRISRRFSAARIPACTADGRKGFLRRVGRMLAARSQKAGRLRQLETARNAILQEAGRRALHPDAGIGLAAEVIADLQAGLGVVIHSGEVSLVQLELWSRLRQRAALLDAEIAVLRGELGLGADPERLTDPSPTLRADQAEQQESCFAALDQHDTQQLPDSLSAPAGLYFAPAPQPVTQRIRRPR